MIPDSGLLFFGPPCKYNIRDGTAQPEHRWPIQLEKTASQNSRS